MRYNLPAASPIAILAASLAASWLLASPAQAEVIESATGGFATRDSATVAADRAQVWAELVHPEGWWTHTWSGESANLWLDAQAGGCFCEIIPAAAPWPDGSAEHMRVVMVQPGRALRMAGALGPLQSEGLAGTLTVTLEEVEGGTRITWDYIAGGTARFDPAAFAAAVDSVQSEFLDALVARLGGAVEGG